MSKRTTLDPITGEPIEMNHMDVEEADTYGPDEEGVEAREQAKQQAKELVLIPPYIEKDFEFRRGNKGEAVQTLLANGKRAYFLQPRAAVVEMTIAMAQQAVDAAFDALSEDDQQVGASLAGEVRDLDYTLGGIDEWVSKLTVRAIARQAASDAVYIARGASLLDSWQPRPGDDNGVERKDSFESTLFTTQRRLGIFLACLQTLDAVTEINLKAAAWQRMQADARKHQQKYLHAEEYHASRALRGDLTVEAQRATSSMLLKRSAA